MKFESTALVKPQAGVAIKSVDQYSPTNFFSSNVMIQMASNTKINQLTGTRDTTINPVGDALRLTTESSSKVCSNQFDQKKKLP